MVHGLPDVVPERSHVRVGDAPQLHVLRPLPVAPEQPVPVSELGAAREAEVAANYVAAMKRMLSIVRQRGQLRVASDDSLCPNAGMNFSPSASDTLRLHSGQRSSPRPNSACVVRRSANPTLFFRAT